MREPRENLPQILSERRIWKMEKETPMLYRLFGSMLLRCRIFGHKWRKQYTAAAPKGWFWYCARRKCGEATGGERY